MIISDCKNLLWVKTEKKRSSINAKTYHECKMIISDHQWLQESIKVLNRELRSSITAKTYHEYKWLQESVMRQNRELRLSKTLRKNKTVANAAGCHKPSVTIIYKQKAGSSSIYQFLGQNISVISKIST